MECSVGRFCFGAFVGTQRRKRKKRKKKKVKRKEVEEEVVVVEDGDEMREGEDIMNDGEV